MVEFYKKSFSFSILRNIIKITSINWHVRLKVLYYLYEALPLFCAIDLIILTQHR